MVVSIFSENKLSNAKQGFFWEINGYIRANFDYSDEPKRLLLLMWNIDE